MNDDYRLSHRAPGPEGDGTTVRLDQVGGEHDEVFPADVGQHPERYGALHSTTVDQVRRASGRRDARVRVWRAVPEGVTEISPGDWVALSEKYARAESQIEHAQVITAEATASELWSEGLLEEWGYQGTAPLRAEPAAAERPLSRASFPQSARAAVASTRTAEVHTQAMTRANRIGPEVGR